ncbi:3'-5' exonuclease [Marinomonas piezotolerans]|nr:3'-5' exonuclease [Marinomonas piezotolerans]
MIMKRPTKEEISALPLYQGVALTDITIVETEQDAKRAFGILKQEVCVGFDTESKPIFQKGQVSPGPSLIQLATESQGFLFPTRFQAALAVAKLLLTDTTIQKIGFGLKDDKRELKSKLNIDIANTLDLSIKLKQMVGEKNSIGARAAVAMVLQQRLGKGAQKSNWGAYPLKESQILYAANDAHSALRTYKALELL